MYTCDDEHEEIVHTGTRCPLCEANKEIAHLKDQSEDYEKEIDRLKQELRDK